MNNIKILDCTLRDGGYINDWNFGENSIKDIINKLSRAKIDIIECGFLTTKGGDCNKTLFNEINEIGSYIEHRDDNIMYVGMIAYPNDIVNYIPDRNLNSIDGIRVTFHEHEIDDALDICKKLIDKGYKVFVQPVGMTSYDDINLIKLIEKVNKINPFSFYIVDTLGTMYKNDLLKIFYLIDNNLDKNIAIGFHSHNNLQLSFSNAQELLTIQTKRNIIIDSSVYGMGRGAGNLCTELITEYINHNIDDRYVIEPILEIIDEYLNNIYAKAPWGYRAPYCLAATNNCHPNYASYLMNRQTISVNSINYILKNIDIDKRTIFDKEYIVELYTKYQEHFIDDNESILEIENRINKRQILIVGPGTSINDEREKINNFIKEHSPYIIAINFIPTNFQYDGLFISNSKRFKNIESMKEQLKGKLLIKTSNIIGNDDILTVNYSSLVVDNSLISDNAGLMLINLLKKVKVNEVFIAGLDGYYINQSNYASNDMELVKERKNIDEINSLIKKEFDKLKNTTTVKFLTKSLYN